MTTEKWQFYSQAGVDGPEYGVRIRPGYVVVGFQKEDAKEIIGLWDEVKRLRSENDRAERAHESLDYMRRHEIASLNARIKELEAGKLMYEEIAESYQIGVDDLRAYIERLEAAFLEQFAQGIQAPKEKAELMAREALEQIKAETGSGGHKSEQREALELDELIAEIERLRSEIEIDNKLLADRDRIYEVCQCPDHGKCTPYVIEQLKSIPEKDARIKELQEACNKMTGALSEAGKRQDRLEAAFLEAKRCPTCNGAGKLIDVVISRKLGGRVESERVCPLCEGKGEEKTREALEEIRNGNKQ